ncbi:hypothetical protein MFLAVUS_011058 [Mucor flavus]|uniref:EKC/KEOPS complex subunit CGI121 n=1 Tax=Mucor flavus TaxID=439312 RepID=A0ABP9ZEG2_9FUNG
MESYTLELNPECGPVHFGLFQNVENASELRQRFSNQDLDLGLSLIDASLVMNRFHVLLALTRAVHDEKIKLKTNHIHSEVAFSFGINNNIGKTFQAFGLKNDTTNVVVIRVGSENTEQAEAYIKERVKGDLVSFDHVTSLRDLDTIKKIYQVDKQVQDEQEIMGLISGAMALKGH